MKIKEFIEKLQQINENEEIYIYGDLEIYEPVIQNLYDTEKEENYYLLTKK